MSAALPHLWRLLRVVADYTRLSAVQRPGRAGDGRASRPQYPGLTGRKDPEPVAWVGLQSRVLRGIWR